MKSYQTILLAIFALMAVSVALPVVEDTADVQEPTCRDLLKACIRGGENTMKCFRNCRGDCKDCPGAVKSEEPKPATAVKPPPETPKEIPTEEPTAEPTVEPTAVPTGVPTRPPTKAPPSKFGAGQWWRNTGRWLTGGGHYINVWDGSFEATCPAGMAFVEMHSVHSNEKEDRQWKLACAPLIGVSRLSQRRGGWTAYNEWDMDQRQQCHDQEFMTGLKSHHDNRKEDRRYSIQCTKVESNSEVVNKDVHFGASRTGVYNGIRDSRMYTHRFANEWDGVLNQRCPNGQALVGMASFHNNRKEDRRYQFKCGGMVSSHR